MSHIRGRFQKPADRLVAEAKPSNPAWNSVMQRRTAIRHRAAAINTQAARRPVTQTSLKARTAAVNCSRMEMISIIVTPIAAPSPRHQADRPYSSAALPGRQPDAGGCFDITGVCIYDLEGYGVRDRA